MCKLIANNIKFKKPIAKFEQMFNGSFKTLSR